MFRAISAGAGAIVLWVALLVGAAFLMFSLNSYFAPKYRALDSKVFHESEQYNEGMIRDLSELQRQYVMSDDNGKAALRPIIRHRFSVYDKDKLPTDLRVFYDSINTTKSF